MEFNAGVAALSSTKSHVFYANGAETGSATQAGNWTMLGNVSAGGFVSGATGVKGSNGSTTPCAGCIGEKVTATTTSGSTSTTTYTAVTNALNIPSAGTWDISATIIFSIARPTGSGIQGCSLRIRNTTDTVNLTESLTGGSTPSDPSSTIYYTVHMKSTVRYTAAKTLYVQIAANAISGSPTFGACTGSASYGNFEAVRRD
jgi:hypothetical protein